MDWWMTAMFVLHPEWYWSRWNVALHTRTHTLGSSGCGWKGQPLCAGVCLPAADCACGGRGLALQPLRWCVSTSSPIEMCLIPAQVILMVEVNAGLQAAGNSEGEEVGQRLAAARLHPDSGVFCEGSGAQRWEAQVSWSIPHSPRFMPRTASWWSMREGLQSFPMCYESCAATDVLTVFQALNK